MADTKQIIYTILNFLERNLSQCTEDQAEALEVAKQCIETGFSFDPQTDSSLCAVPYQLEEIFTTGLSQLQQQSDRASSSSRRPIIKQATEKEKQEAEVLKTKGNEMMKEEKYEEAVKCYSDAITKDPSMAVFYCNRAAARSKLGEHEAALKDCEQSIQLSPSYSKAYGRKGLAHSALNQHTAARDCFKKALQLDSSNQSYQQNLEIAEQKIRDEASAAGSNPLANFGGMDLNSMFNNPALMNMASTMMSSPQMQNMISSMIQGAAPGGTDGAPNMSNFLQAGQQFAQQMQSENPELIDQLRNQMRNDNNSNENPDDNNPPPSQ